MWKRIKQQYHLEPNRGLLNDPNGLAFFNEEYHVFFQWNRFEKNHNYKEWGHFISKDLISWEFKGSALIPDQFYDIDGVYSGSGYVIDNKLFLFYTGNNKREDKRKSRQCLAISEDGVKFLKKGSILETPKYYTEHFRDPKVFKENNNYFMLLGAQRENGKGAIALCCSNDGINWHYKDVLAFTDNYEMIECPDLFKLNGKYVLLFCPQKRDNEKDTAGFSFSTYKIENFDPSTGKIDDKNLDCGYSVIDYGFDFYAPQTFEDKNKRRILYGWMSRLDEKQEQILCENAPNIHCLTLPRELHLYKNKLYQTPVKELYKLLGEELTIEENIQSVKEIYPKNYTFYMNISNINENNGIVVEFNNGEANLEYNFEENKIIFSRLNCVDNQYQKKYCCVDDLKDIEVWSDNSSLEIFINKGEFVFSSRIFPKNSKPEIRIKGIGKSAIIKANDIAHKVIKGGEFYD